MEARDYMRLLGKRRWELMTTEQKAAHIRRMVAAQKRTKKHNQAKARGAK